MTNIIGPISLDDWYLMRQLRSHIKSMNNTNKERYREDIILYRDTYMVTMKEYLDGN